ncbi:MAG: hypothetical protein HY016_00995, partial [Nitrosomonadales bacterium]|nr:hypothetical protein [Nitrosomonadales bacterium]
SLSFDGQHEMEEAKKKAAEEATGTFKAAVPPSAAASSTGAFKAVVPPAPAAPAAGSNPAKPQLTIS